MIRTLATLICVWLSSSAAAQIELPQHGGGTLTLEQPARTVVTLAPNLAELAFAAGGTGKLIATVEYSDYPPAAAALPRVGDAFRVDLERLLALSPDLVITWVSGNPSQVIGRAEDLGLPVWRTELTHMRDIPALLRLMGHAMNTEQVANTAATSLEQRLDRLQDDYSGRATTTYFYQVSEKPLYTLNGEHLVSSALSMCGGKNIFSDAQTLAPVVSVEEVITRDPGIMFAPRGPGSPASLEQWRVWPDIQAVENNHLYYLDADMISRASPRFFDAVEAACEHFDKIRQADNSIPRG